MDVLSGIIGKIARYAVPRIHSLFRGHQPSLTALLFHSLYKDRATCTSGRHDPQQGITVEEFKEIVSHFRSRNYLFLDAARLQNLPADFTGRAVMLTFDDGYFNNVYALPILEEYEVPVTIFISSGHVQNGCGFWWDVLYREELKRTGRPPGKDQAMKLKRLPPAGIRAALEAQYGLDCWNPTGDENRPLSVSELIELAAHPLVSLGNHTRDHAILTVLSEDECRAEIEACQSDLREWTGRSPTVIAYPNGNHSRQVRRVASACGLRYGITVEGRKEPLPLSANSETNLALGRFVPWGGDRRSLRRQLNDMAHDFGILSEARFEES